MNAFRLLAGLAGSVWFAIDVAALPMDTSSGYVSQAHVGQYFTVDASGHVTPQVCEIWNGKGTITCPLCKGKGSLVCPICNGRKAVPESWTAFDNPKMKNRPDRFKPSVGGS